MDHIRNVWVKYVPIIEHPVFPEPTEVEDIGKFYKDSNDSNGFRKCSDDGIPVIYANYRECIVWKKLYIRICKAEQYFI